VDIRQTALAIATYFSEIGKQEIKRRKFISQDIWRKFPVGFFDGACNNTKCGCDALIVGEPRNYFHLWWEGGRGKKTE